MVKDSHPDMSPEEQNLTQHQLKDILSRTSKDRIVYESSLVLFNERVDFVENEVGFRFLHCAKKMNSR